MYWYTSGAIGKWFVDTIGKIFHVILLLFARWFISISIPYLRDHSISVYQTRYSTSVVDKYVDTATVKKSKTIIGPLCHIILY